MSSHILFNMILSINGLTLIFKFGKIYAVIGFNNPIITLYSPDFIDLADTNTLREDA
ncbi:ATP synthase subunit a (fragment) [Xenorhabdus doucetiae]|uniref:ATP synthase subunit a n=1 Tax=Xenorhabdus doucetiae TaxID=351671 RepID=A0A068QQR7_9GAMM